MSLVNVKKFCFSTFFLLSVPFLANGNVEVVEPRKQPTELKIFPSRPIEFTIEKDISFEKMRPNLPEKTGKEEKGDKPINVFDGKFGLQRGESFARFESNDLSDGYLPGCQYRFFGKKGTNKSEKIILGKGIVLNPSFESAAKVEHISDSEKYKQPITIQDYYYYRKFSVLRDKKELGDLTVECHHRDVSSMAEFLSGIQSNFKKLGIKGDIVPADGVKKLIPENSFKKEMHLENKPQRGVASDPGN